MDIIEFNLNILDEFITDLNIEEDKEFTQNIKQQQGITSYVNTEESIEVDL